MDNKRILIVADSMGMPRPGVAYEKTWIYRLIHANAEFEFIDKSKRGSTTERFIDEGADLLEHYLPDSVITQIGIVDCAPRYFLKKSVENILLQLMPVFIRKKYITLMKKTGSRKPENAYVSPRAFCSNLENYFQRAQTLNVQIFAILIAPPSKRFVKKSPFINQNIKIYNDIYEKLSRKFNNVILVQPFSFQVDLENITLDEYHLNATGHDMIFQNLMTCLCQK